MSEPIDAARLRAALIDANLPSLVPVLFQLTGERRWLHAPFAPQRGRGMDDNQDGGLPEHIGDEIRAAAFEAVLAWSQGAAPAVPAPRGAQLRELLDVAMGEPVPAEFEPMMAESLGFAARPVHRPAPGADEVRVVVIGAGVSGLVAAKRLRDELGVQVTVLEKNDDVGGTWLENRYPGAGVDTPSHLYSVSFFDWEWSTYFGRRNEVEAYLRAFADAFDLRSLIRFGTEVAEARWDAGTQRWVITTSTGEELRAQVLVSAVGQLNRPKAPPIPGADEFTGPIFHSAEWPQDLDLTGQRVAVVGTGASAMQIVPAIAADVAELTIFQRSPQWIAPTSDIFRRVGDDAHWLIAHLPFYREWYRARLAWTFNDKVHSSLQVDPEWAEPARSVNAVNDSHRRVFTRYLDEQLDGRPDLRAKSLPDYPPFGKRMLLDNGWFGALRRPNVRLVDEQVRRISSTGVHTANVDVEADVVIMCTGFHAHRFLYPMRVTGASGRTLAETWGEEDATAYLGLTVPDFPNLFVLLGPNTALGHGGSIITISEFQVEYVLQAVETMIRDGIGMLDCRDDVHKDYVARVDCAHDSMIWTHPGMTNWYRNAAGRVVSTLPWRIVDYREMLRHFDAADYVTKPRRASAAVTRG